MKKTLTLLMFVFLSNAYSQKDPNIYDFFGGKSFKNKTVFFRLVFKINNDKFNGYMFTDEQGSGETKSIIEGKINSKTNTIFFTETRKLSSKTKPSFDEPCYLSGHINLTLNPKISKLKGVFTEQTLSNKECSNGTINLISPDAYIKLKEQLALTKETSKIQLDTIQFKNSNIPTFESDKKTTIKDNDELTIYWTSNKLKIEVWDDMKEDGDKISIQLNNELILDKYELKNAHKTIEINLEEEENTLTFTANNTGYLANNTARVDLIDNKLKHQIVTQLQLNKSVSVIIKKQTTK